MNELIIEITLEDIETDKLSFEMDKREIWTEPHMTFLILNTLNTILESEMNKTFEQEKTKIVINDNSDLKVIYLLEDEGTQLAYTFPKEKWELRSNDRN